MKTLTKKEISENVRVSRRNGFGNGFDFSATVRGFNFETLTGRPTGELMETDDTGYMTFVANVGNKKEVVNSIYEWFQNYASQEFDS